MKQPKRTKKPSNENGLAFVVGLPVLLLILIGCICGCEEVQTRMPTTMPAGLTQLSSPEQIVTARRKELTMQMDTWVVDYDRLILEYADWVENAINAEALAQQVVHSNGTEEEVAAMVRTCEAMDEILKDYDKQAFALRTRLMTTILEQRAWNSQYRGWWLFREGAKVKK